ncbi:MAG TPA: hypothetical protein ENJ09_03950 [Planctomycetes bacterium]|nr:hypothetical protein [Planctomycetota bacterium]
MTHDHAPGTTCPKCWARLRTPLFCESCKEPLDPGDDASPFETLGVEPTFPVDRMALRKRLLSLSRNLHPDYYAAGGDEARERAERSTARLNAAFELLADDFRRASWFVKSLGGPSESEERAMPAEFLAEVMEWNETIEEARSAAPAEARERLEPLAAELRAERDRIMRSVAQGLTPLPEANAPVLRDLRRSLNVVRYLDRALEQIDEVLLDAPPSR